VSSASRQWRSSGARVGGRSLPQRPQPSRSPLFDALVLAAGPWSLLPRPALPRPGEQ
jgi:hypothetical protein